MSHFKKPNPNILIGSINERKEMQEVANKLKSIVKAEKDVQESVTDSESELTIKMEKEFQEEVNDFNSELTVKVETEIKEEIIDCNPELTVKLEKEVQEKANNYIKSESTAKMDVDIIEIEDDSSESESSQVKRRKTSNKKKSNISKTPEESTATDFLSKLKASTKTDFVVCPFCDRRIRKNYFIKHARIHTGEKPFRCTECNYSSAGSAALIKHKEDFNH